MSSLLKKIQRSLSAEKEKGLLSYLKYAVGEIFLVVIGILIALQVNTYNQNQKEARMEREYLKNIALNIENSNRELERIISETDTQILQIDSLRNVMAPGAVQTSDTVLLNWIVSISDYSIYSADDSTAKELLATGRLTLIRDPAIRELISSWETRLHNIWKFEQECNYWYREYNSYLENNIDWYRIVYTDSIPDQVFSEGFLTDGAFNWRLNGLYRNTRSLNYFYKREKSIMDSAYVRIENLIQPLPE